MERSHRMNDLVRAKQPQNVHSGVLPIDTSTICAHADPRHAVHRSSATSRGTLTCRAEIGLVEARSSHTFYTKD